MIINFKNLKKEYFFFLGFSFFIIVFSNYLLFPVDAHYYVANLETAPNSISKSIYNIIRAPLYTFYGLFYNSYVLYFFASIAHLGLFLILFYRSLLKTNNSKFFSFVILLFFSPLTFSILIFLANHEYFEYFKPILLALSKLGPFHFGWSTQGFTPRLFSGILLIVIFNYLIRSKYKKGGVFSIILFLCHPNNAVAIISWFSLFLIIKYLFNKVSLKRIFNFFLLSFLGFVISFVLIYTKSQILEGTNDFYSLEWYLDSYHINAPNFSALYYVISEPFIIFFRIAIVLLISLFSYKYLKSKYVFDLFILSIIPVFMFFITLLIEFLISKEVLEFNLLNRFIVSGQFGLKILELSFFPILLIIGVWAKNKINFVPIKIISNYFIFISIIIPCIIISNFTYFQSHIKGLYYNYNYNILLEKTSNKHGNQMLLPIKTSKSETDFIYMNKFSEFNDFIDLKSKILSYVPKGSLIIVPPYQDKFRDLLIDYEIFYQDVPDASLFLGGGNSSQILKDRFELLFDKNFKDFKTYGSGLYWTDLRNEFINLDNDAFIRIKRKTNKNKIYLITESNIFYDFNLIFSNKAYSLFEF